MTTISSIQNIITAYSQQLKYKERLASVKKVETQQAQKDSVSISKEGKRLLKESHSLKEKTVPEENLSPAENVNTSDNNAGTSENS
ncbi:MAG: hypothetical protein AAB257_05790 [Nitrospinota bacterium]